MDMEPNSREPQIEAEAGLRQIPKWARRYAQNRTLPVLASLLIYATAAAVFFGLPHLIVWAYKAGERFLAAVVMLILCGFAVWWVWFCFVGGVAIMRQITERLYRGEGSVLTATSQVKAPTRPPPGVFVFMFCVLANTGLGLLGFFPVRLMQPISALYVVPFMCYLGLKMHGTGSPFMFLWPALYGIHAILIVAGAPISLGPAFDMFVPTVGYGLIAALAGHIYSRIALRRLRALAASRESGSTADGEQP
jgi:hypothetical protein